MHATLCIVRALSFPDRWIGAVAQLGERCVRNAEVRGSIPLSSTPSLPVEPRRLALASNERAHAQILSQPDIDTDKPMRNPLTL